MLIIVSTIDMTFISYFSTCLGSLRREVIVNVRNGTETRYYPTPWQPAEV
jgi:hypothetical protein